MFRVDFLRYFDQTTSYYTILKKAILIDTFKDKGQRAQLVKQLRTKGIGNEQILKAIETVPRHFFVDKTFAHLAYKDQAIKIDEQQTISMPYTVAYQSNWLDLKPGMKVLEVGTGSGYQAAILHNLNVEVHSIERFEKLHKKAKRSFMFLNYKINCVYGDGFKGLPTIAPFDRIIVTAEAPRIPKTLLMQLNTNGIIVVPVKNESGITKMLKIQKLKNDQLEIEEGELFKFVPMLEGIV